MDEKTDFVMRAPGKKGGTFSLNFNSATGYRGNLWYTLTPIPLGITSYREIVLKIPNNCPAQFGRAFLLPEIG
jgi:hypothetical protein